MNIAQLQTINKTSPIADSLKHPLDRHLIGDVRDYIKDSWQLLKRTPQDLLHIAIDPKFCGSAQQKYTFFISPYQDYEVLTRQFANRLSLDEFNQVEIKVLPTDLVNFETPGLLYLPHPYIVPGGRFNEMYAWDSYFIILGLLRDNQIDLAKNMADNLLYQIEYYNKVLCANRTYYLPRSQPPLVSRAVLAIYQKIMDKTWLASTLSALQKLYSFWNTYPHLIEPLGLSRYYDLGHGPAPEAVSSEVDSTGLNHYQRVKEYYRSHELDAYNVSEFFDLESNALKPKFYKGDRSLRESGFDLTSRFGPFGAQTISYAPVCLNTLLYQMEIDLSDIHALLNVQSAASSWRQRAQSRAKLINKYLWSNDLGYYFDYNFESRQINNYIYATTFYPLWAGFASEDQAKRIVHNLCVLECEGGLLTSAYMTGQQWDAPFGWAPLHYFAVNGLRRYGYHKEAKRISEKFLTSINLEFHRYGKIFEKYDVVNQTSFVGDSIQFGYDTNEVGFGWTNAIYLELLDYLQGGELS